MPRSGLRPYECVRKAWHSDRHLPIRGSLIQEIFRYFLLPSLCKNTNKKDMHTFTKNMQVCANMFVLFIYLFGFRIVNENHSSATKKNKEWQEKLPIVVLKAEEILYSKANSEVC